MLQDIPNLANTDPKVSKAAALNIIQHVSQNKGELGYLVKRLVCGLQSLKVSTRTSHYSTLCVLLRLQLVEASRLFELMQKALITNKQSTKRERRLVYIARILCTGAILRNSAVAEMSKDEGFLRAALHDLVDLSLKKSSYFQLATPFLAHVLRDNSMTQEVFDTLVWPSIGPLMVEIKGSSSKSSKKKNSKKKSGDDDEEERDDPGDGDDEEDEQEENSSSVNFACKVQVALACGEYKKEFECLKDVRKIVKAFLVSRLQFEETFVKSLLSHLHVASSPPDPENECMTVFWISLVENVKSTQFDLLCLCVEKAAEEKIPISRILSKKLISLLVSVFKQSDSVFHAKARKAIGTILTCYSSSMLKKKTDDNANTAETHQRLSKKERKTALKCMFGGDPPNILHEYKYVHSSVRQFVMKLDARDLQTLHGIIVANLTENVDKLGPRMSVIYLQVLGLIAQAKNVTASTSFEIGKMLLNLGLGNEQLAIEIRKKKKKTESEEGKDEEGEDDKEGESEDEDDPTREVEEKAMHEQIKKCASDGLHTILSATYNYEFMKLMSEYLLESGKDVCGTKEVVKVLKNVKKAESKQQKETCNAHLMYAMWAYALRVVMVGNASVVIDSPSEAVEQLMDVAGEDNGGSNVELIKFLLGTVVKERNPAFNYEGMFNKMLIEGVVGDDAVQALAEAVEVGDPEGAEEEDDDDDDDDDEDMEISAEDDEEEEEGDTQPPPKKKPKQGNKGMSEATPVPDSDSEESIALDEATEEDLLKMDTALAKVFAIKKAAKEESTSTTRALMRSLRLVNVYVSRNLKTMPVSALLILLMPVVHTLQACSRMKKNPEVTTRVIGVLDTLNRVKKFSGCDDVVEGTLATIAEELYTMACEKKNKLIRELLEGAVVMLTRCFVGKSVKAKKESKRFVQLYKGAVDKASAKLRKRKVKSKTIAGEGGRKVPAKRGWKNFNTSKFVRFALDAFGSGDLWVEGKQAIEERIQRRNSE